MLPWKLHASVKHCRRSGRFQPTWSGYLDNCDFHSGRGYITRRRGHQIALPSPIERRIPPYLAFPQLVRQKGATGRVLRGTRAFPERMATAALVCFGNVEQRWLARSRCTCFVERPDPLFVGFFYLIWPYSMPNGKTEPEPYCLACLLLREKFKL